MELREKYLRRAEKEAFQEIADSPTMKYYTNWKEFTKRMDADDSREFVKLPGWVEEISDKRIVLSRDASVEGIPEDYVGLYWGDYDILADIKAVGKMEYYHAARLQNVVTLRLPRDENVGRLVIVSLGGDGYTGHHIRLDMEESSTAEVILVDLAGGWNTSIKTLTMFVNLGENSRLKLYSLSLHGDSAVYSRRIYNLNARSRLELNTLYSSGDSTRINEDVYLNGEYSEAEMTASSLSTGKKWGDILLNVRHKGLRSNSYINGRGVVLEDGLLTMRGIAIVEKEAEWSTSHVEVHVSSFGEKARGNASPMLEIHTGNVEEAFHSASVASLSENELFYLESRGLNRDEARQLLVEGMLQFSGVLERLNLTTSYILNTSIG